MLKKWQWISALGAVAVGVATMAYAATSISNLSGQSCGDDDGNWHFVNNQTGGAAAGTLTANWSSSDSCSVGPSAINAKVQHFNCVASGTLLGAVTTLPGKLVLSDFSCNAKCEPDPKTGECPK